MIKACRNTLSLQDMERKDHGLLRRLILTYGVGLWRTIRNQWPRMWSNFIINVGNGRKTLFWNDIRVGQTPLRQ